VGVRESETREKNYKFTFKLNKLCKIFHSIFFGFLKGVELRLSTLELNFPPSQHDSEILNIFFKFNAHRIQ
jgi:hypothetical protein